MQKDRPSDEKSHDAMPNHYSLSVGSADHKLRLDKQKR